MRRGVAGLAAALLLLAGVFLLPGATSTEEDRGWSFVVVVTDDQPAGSLPHAPSVMPYLQAATEDPDDHWLVFRNGHVNVPLCCPSRVTMLTGRYAHNHGVATNDDGARLDESSTLPVWLHDAGYHTGLVGKYLNQYPFGRDPYVPEGWDRWWGKEQGPLPQLYYGYTLIEQGVPRRYGGAPRDYSTDVFAAAAVEFIRDAPGDRPFFLWFAPTAPHPPWVPAPRHRGVFETLPLVPQPNVGEADVSDKPAWVRALPPLGSEVLAGLRHARLRSFETLRAVDDAVRAIVAALRARGDLDRTVIVYLSDNGFSFGEHRWVTKTCPYAACVRVPFLIRHPLAPARQVEVPVSAVDLAPTIADLAGVVPAAPVDGTSLAPLITEADAATVEGAVYSEWIGDARIPGWWQVRTQRFAYVELATGERELYDLVADPYELENVAADERYAATVARLAAALDAFRGS